MEKLFNLGNYENFEGLKIYEILKNRSQYLTIGETIGFLEFFYDNLDHVYNFNNNNYYFKTQLLYLFRDKNNTKLVELEIPSFSYNFNAKDEIESIKNVKIREINKNGNEEIFNYDEKKYTTINRTIFDFCNKRTDLIPFFAIRESSSFSQLTALPKMLKLLLLRGINNILEFKNHFGDFIEQIKELKNKNPMGFFINEIKKYSSFDELIEGLSDKPFGASFVNPTEGEPKKKKSKKDKEKTKELNIEDIEKHLNENQFNEENKIEEIEEIEESQIEEKKEKEILQEKIKETENQIKNSAIDILNERKKYETNLIKNLAHNELFNPIKRVEIYPINLEIFNLIMQDLRVFYEMQNTILLQNVIKTSKLTEMEREVARNYFKNKNEITNE